jgi:integrase
VSGDQKFGTRVDLTPSFIKSLKPRARAYEVADRRVIGLRIVVYRTGNRSFAIRYPFHGRSRNHTIGPYPRLKIADARKIAAKKLRDVHSGLDPAKEKADQLKASKSGTVAQAFAAFDAGHLVKRRSARETRRIFNKYVLPKWRARPLIAITKSDVIDVLKAISAPAMSNRTYSALSKFFRWCSAHDLIQTAPTLGVSKLHSENKGRDRILNDREIRWYWRACDQLRTPYGPLLKLCLAVGCRKGEAANIRWDDVDWDTNIWTIAQTKTDAARQVYLTPMTTRLLRSFNMDHDYIFGPKPPSGWSKAKKELDSLMAKAAIEDFESPPPAFIIHDTRRTARSILARLGVPPEVAKRAVGHNIAGMDKIYDRHTYADELKAAFEKLEAFIAELVGTQALP